MSCNGCRVLRKGCSETCILRPCLQWIESPESQGHATVFVAKFFGRAGLMSFISAVPESQRPSLFQSLLFEAAGRTVNPVNGAVGLLWTGNWQVCQAAVETVLRGGALPAIPEFLGENPSLRELDESSEAEVTCTGMLKLQDPCKISKSKVQKRRRIYEPEQSKALPTADLDLSLTAAFPSKKSPEKRRSITPSLNSEESGTTSCLESGIKVHAQRGGEPKLLNFF
ncbi:hypothetical protein RJ639_006843 [Escallonia herrerae]|uniref:LOB domain-containing protein n=1 Tax=Escallonia herrerae TaxID=1293975 RepID=A0AA88W3N0_9ASTE|nr:hypothetical protein RJ639_006843 [Escallonia herrerae]